MRGRLLPPEGKEWAPIATDVLRCQDRRMIGLSNKAYRIYVTLLGLSAHYRTDTHERRWSAWLSEFGTQRRDRSVSYWRAITECTTLGLIGTDWLPNGSESEPNGTKPVQIVVAGLRFKGARLEETRLENTLTTKDKNAGEVKTLKPKTPAQIQNAALVEAVKKAWDQVSPNAPLSWPFAQKFTGQCQRRDISPAWLARYVAGRRPVNPIAYAQRMLTGRERLEPDEPGSSWGRWVSDTLPAPEQVADIIAGVAGRWRVDE